MKYEKLLPRFLEYVKVNTRSDKNSTTTPSTQALVEFAHKMGEDMKALGLKRFIIWSPMVILLGLFLQILIKMSVKLDFWLT